ncbi:MAG: class I SAM-dependent methyltransferase [Bacteroidales bacterium]
MEKPIVFDKVADLYDSYVRVDFDVPFFLQETTNHTTVLELMSGTGRVSIPLLKNGRKLVCVDYSQGMLDRFSEKISGTEYDVKLICADVTTLSLGTQFDCIILPFHSLQEIVSKESQLNAIKSIHRHLTNGGIFVCTLQNPRIRLADADGSIKSLGTFLIDEFRQMKLSCSNKIENGIVTGFQLYEIYNQQKLLIERRVLDVCFRPIEYEEFVDMLNESGFTIKHVFGDYDYSEFDIETSPYMLFRLGK